MHMKTNEKFENGLSIVQLEERYEMVAAGLREGNQDSSPTLPCPEC